MSDFINTGDVIGDEELMDQIILRTVTEFKDDAVTSVGNNAFRKCTRLTEVSLPAVTNVHQSSFEGSGIRKIYLPELKGIGMYAFIDCVSLSALILGGGVMCPLGNRNSFNNSSIAKGTGYIYVPRSLVDSYKSATNWSNFANQFRALEDYTVDGTITGDLDESKI